MAVKTSSSEDKNPVKSKLGLGGSTTSWKPGNFGDALGMAFRAQANPLGEAAKNVKQTPASMGSVTGTRSQQQAADRNQYLAEQKAQKPSDVLTEGGGGGGGPAGPSAYELQSQKDRARLAALYDAYSKQVSGAQGNINTNYDAARAAMGDIYGNAASQTNLGYDAARAALTAQMQALGLSGIMPPSSTEAQLAAADRYTNLGTIAQTQTEAQRQADLANNQALVNAISGENRGALENFDRTVSENVARQQQAQAEAAASAAAAANSAAAKQAEQDWQHQYLYDKLAAGAQTRTPVDVAGLYNQFIANKVDPETALKLAAEQAKYMG